MTKKEEMARAICSVPVPGLPDEVRDFDQFYPWRREYLMACATAALQALREPNSAMVEAGSNAVYEFLHDDTETECWKAMIDAALKEKP